MTMTAPHGDKATTGVIAGSSAVVGAQRERYRRLHRTLGGVIRAWVRLDVSGTEHIPAAGGAILCPRHENLSDPFVLGAAVPPERAVHFLAWDGVLEMPLVGRWIKSLGVVHTIKAQFGKSQDADHVRRTMETLAAIVGDGHLVTVFPEGNINHWFGRGGLKPFRTGAVRLAARAGVPLVPIGTTGTRWVVPSLFNFHDLGGPDFAPWIPVALPWKVRVRFGPPLVVDPAAADSKAVAEHETARLRVAVQRLVGELTGNAPTTLPPAAPPQAARPPGPSPR
ncbi:MAG: 1-acyl-sn-glycerol-3-phosphate acyltransferase [Deltaproteobacteria bacterium]|nr:1-acyl-sn-glycerol-3-phosphate acyltransferase [Deltaproteobacteria bacterium]